MPKVGVYDIPSRDLDDCVNYVRKAVDIAKSKVMSRETFAQAIGQSVKGGGFGLLVGSMATYELVDTGGGEIRLTQLGEQILYGETREQTKGKESAVRKVQLFADIHDRFGSDVTDEQLRLFLREKAKVEMSEANRLATEVGKLLKRNLPYLTPTVDAGEGEKKTPDKLLPAGSLTGWSLSTDSYGELRIVDELSADYAINVLKKFKERFEEKTIKLATPEQLGWPTSKQSDREKK